MAVDEPPLACPPGDPQKAGHGAPTRRQNRADQKHLGVPPTPLEKQRRKA
jgi:hypothetical protein